MSKKNVYKDEIEDAFKKDLQKKRDAAKDIKLDLPDLNEIKVDPPKNDAKIPVPNVENVSAPGYKPDFSTSHSPVSDVPKTSGLTTPGSFPTSDVEKPKATSTLPSNGLNDTGRPDRKESAPDIGKDYGSGLPESQPNPQSAKVPKDRNDKKDSIQNQAPTPVGGGANEGKTLPKKDGLDDKDKGLQDKDSDKKKTKNEDKNKSNQSMTPGSSNNGYGALNNNPKNKVNNDSTSMARRNFEHNRRVQQGESESSSTKDSKTQAGKNNKQGLKGKAGLQGKQSNNGTSDIKDGSPGLGARLRNRLRGGKRKPGTPGNKGLAGGGKAAIKRKILEFLATHPFACIVIGVVLLFIIILIATDDATNGGNGKGAHCTYNLSGVSTSGEVKLEGLQVELINCDGTASNYTVLETVDFEKYVLGVALAEIGPDSPDEAIKTQIVAARGFALTRNSGMCPGNPDGCFYGYNASTGKIRMRACEADQVYWDYEKDIYRQDRGSISVYSPEINSGSLWKAALNETRKAEVLELADQVKGKVLVDSSNNVVKTNYVASVSDRFISLASEGKSYEQILAEVYSDSDGFSSGECTSYGNIDYGDYVLSSDGDEILHQPLDSFLRSKGTSTEEFAALIAENVEKAGYGTRAGVVAAAVTLIAELGNNYDVKIPYFWGGGHADGVVDGVLGYWGSTQCHTYANGQSYNYCGFDCSGFVPWAIKNGGFNVLQNLAGNFQNLSGARRVSLSNSPVLEPGDLLESSGHIVLVIGIEEASGNYICAEASGNSSGVLFTRRPFNSSGYWGVKMDGYYETHARR